jgi:hypothetical protein
MVLNKYPVDGTWLIHLLFEGRHNASMLDINLCLEILEILNSENMAKT